MNGITSVRVGATGRRLVVSVLLGVSLLVVLAAPALGSGLGAGDISTVAGNGFPGFSGDGGPATAAMVNFPQAVAATADGGFLITDGSRIRRVAVDGTITTVAGTGTAGFSGDGGPATSAELHFPWGVAVTADGGFLIADMFNHRVRRVAADGTITTVAGTGAQGFAGDGGPATDAQLAQPSYVAPTADGGFLIADDANHRIRRVAADGTITTVAGTGDAGFAGDGGPATDAQLFNPNAVAVTADGGFLIADQNNHRVRRVAAGGTITTVAGTGSGGYSGDGGPAVAAQLNHPEAIAVTADGGFLIADHSNNAIRRVAADGTIATVAGTGTTGYSGDGGPATAAKLSPPWDVAVTADGGFLIADANNHRVRRVGGPSAASGANTTLMRSPTRIVADGVSTSTITVRAKDQYGNARPSGDTVVLHTSRGSLSTVTDQGGGTYTATLTSSTTAGNAKITGEVNGDPITHPSGVDFGAGPASGTKTTIGGSPSKIVADGVAAATITVHARDQNGNPLKMGGDAVTLHTTRGALSVVTDHGNGTYTATLTSSTVAGAAKVTGEINGNPITDTGGVNLVAGPGAGSTTTMGATPMRIVADGVSTTTVTVRARDQFNNVRKAGGDVVTLSTTRGGLSSVVDHGNGTYTATLTSSTSPGPATITGTINSQSITAHTTVTFTHP